MAELRFRDDEALEQPAVTLDGFLDQSNATAVRLEPDEDARLLIPHLDRLALDAAQVELRTLGAHGRAAVGDQGTHRRDPRDADRNGFKNSNLAGLAVGPYRLTWYPRTTTASKSNASGTNGITIAEGGTSISKAGGTACVSSIPQRAEKFGKIAQDAGARIDASNVATVDIGIPADIRPDAQIAADKERADALGLKFATDVMTLPGAPVAPEETTAVVPAKKGKK